MLLLTVLAAVSPPLSVRYVYVLCPLSLFCGVYVGSALLSEPYICVNSVFTFEVLHHASLRPLLSSSSLLHCFDSLSRYGELADPQIVPLTLFYAKCLCKKKVFKTFHLFICTFRCVNIDMWDKQVLCLHWFIGTLHKLSTALTFYCISPMCWNNTITVKAHFRRITASFTFARWW